GVDADVRADANAVGDAEEDQAAEQERGEFERPHEAVVEDVARDDLHEGDDRHQGQKKGNEPFLQPPEGVGEPPADAGVHGASPRAMSVQRTGGGPQPLDFSAASIRSLPMSPSNFFHTGSIALRHAATSSFDSSWIFALPASEISLRSRSLKSLAILFA